MKFFKNTKAKLDASYQDFVNSARPHALKFFQKLRLPGRIRLAIRWANKNPKKTCYSAMSVLVILFIFSLVSVFYSPQKTKIIRTEELYQLESVSNMITGITKIDEKKMEQKQIIEQLAIEALEAKETYDSLMRLPSLTHEDSIAAYECHAKLKHVAKILNYDAK